MLGRSARWVAAAAACVVVLVLPSAIRADVVGVTVSADSTTAGDTNAVWTVSFTPQADLDFLASDTVTVEFPSGFDVSGATFESFSGCFLSSSPSASGQQVTVPLPPGCSIVGGTPSSVELSGISPAAGTYAASEFAVSTSQETTPVAATGSDIVISGGGGGGGATSVTNVTFSGSSTAAAATSTWTVGFTSSSSGQLAGGAGFGYVLVTFPSGFGTPSSAAFATGFSCNGQAAVPQDVGGGTVELDLPSGCTLAASTAATVTLTLTNPSSAGSYTGASVSTSSDQNFVAPASAIAISGQLFTVQFDRNGGSGTMADQTFTGGVAQALDTNAFTFTSHTFAGWNTAADGSGTAYSDGQSITVNADTTLYAQWVGPPAQLVVSRQPAGATALSPFATQPVVRVEDAQGHLVTGSTATITASASSCAGTLAGTTTQTAAAGVAAFTDLSIGAAGSCTLRFADTTDNLTTTSQTFTAGKIPTSLSVSISPDKPAYTFGDTVTITATATGIPDGTTITIASLNATLHGGTASVSTPVFTLEPLPADVSFDAKYAGDTSHATAKGSIGRKLDKAPSATTVAWDAGSGTLTATVASRDPLSLGGDPTPFKAVFGSVEFFDAASGKSLGTAQISQGVATLTPSASALPAGTHTIRASSTGHHWLLPSTGQLGNVVVPTRKTDLTVTASKTTLQWDRPLTLTVAVPPEATGSIAFSYRVLEVQGKKYRGKLTHFADATIHDGVARLELHSAQAPGVVEYWAVYAGDGTYEPASEHVAITTTTRPLKLHLDVSDTTPLWGTKITLTATLDPDTVEGKVQFSYAGDDAEKLDTVTIADGKATLVVEAPPTPGAERKVVAHVPDTRYDVDDASAAFTVQKRPTHVFAVDCDGSGTALSCPVRRNSRIVGDVNYGRYWYVAPYWGPASGTAGTQNEFGRTVTELTLPKNRMEKGTIEVWAGSTKLAVTPLDHATYTKKLCTLASHPDGGPKECGVDPEADRYYQETSRRNHERYLGGGEDAFYYYFTDGDSDGALDAPLAGFDFGPLRALLPRGTKTVRFVFTPADPRYATSKVDVDVPAPGKALAASPLPNGDGLVGFTPESGSGAASLTIPPGTFPKNSTVNISSPAVKSQNTFLGPEGTAFDITVTGPDGREYHGPFTPPLKITFDSYQKGCGDPPAPSVYGADGKNPHPLPRLASEDLGGRADGYVATVTCGYDKSYSASHVVILTTHLTMFTIVPRLTAKTGKRAILHTRTHRLAFRVKPSRPAAVRLVLVRGPRRHPKLVALLGTNHVGARGRIVRFRVPRAAMTKRGLRLSVSVVAANGETRTLVKPVVRRR